MNYGDAPQPSRIFIVDDHPLIRRVLYQLLSLEPSLTVVGEAVSAEDALLQLDRGLPDLLLVDFSLPGMDGAQLIQKLREKHPLACCVVISSYYEAFYVKRALDAGAHGYVTKGDPDVLIGAISRVLQGEIVVEVST